jgi:hypothetical protein
VDEPEFEDEGEGEDEHEDEGEEEVGEEDEEDGVYLSKDLKTAPKPTDFVVDLEDEEVEEEEQEVGKKGKRSKKAYIPNSTTPLDQQKFLNSCPIPKELSALSWIERQHRLMKYELRLKSILESLQHSAQAISWENVRTGNSEDNGMTLAWWHFLCYMSIKLVLPMLLKAAPETVCLVLGGPLSREELLWLPAKWKGVTLFGVYHDVVTGQTVGNDDEMEGYVGSGAGAKGLDQRVSNYASVNRGTRKPDSTSAHEKLISQKGSNINLRVLAVFDAASTSRPYVVLSELCHTILLQTWEDRPGKLLTPASIDIMREATPNDVAVKKFKGLNRASQLLQGLSAPRKGRYCDNCKRRDVASYRNAIPGLAFQTIVCDNCHSYQKAHGRPRPTRLEQKRIIRAENLKPADAICEIGTCDGSIQGGNAVFDYVLKIWTCKRVHEATPADEICEMSACDKAAVGLNRYLEIRTCGGHLNRRYGKQLETNPARS